MFMALQMLMGGLMLLGVALAHGDSVHWPPNASGLIALVLPDLLQFLPGVHRLWLAEPATPRRP